MNLQWNHIFPHLLCTPLGVNKSLGTPVNLQWNHIFPHLLCTPLGVSKSLGTPINLQWNHIFPHLLWTPSGRCKLYTLQYDSNVWRYVSDVPCYTMLSCAMQWRTMLSCAMQWSVGWAVMRCEVFLPAGWSTKTRTPLRMRRKTRTPLRMWGTSTGK